MYRDHPAIRFTEVIGPDSQVIDVREPHELADGTLPGVINIPLGELTDRMHELDLDRRVVLICRTGGRSAFAAEQLAAVGFDDVVNLAGGMITLSDLPTH